MDSPFVNISCYKFAPLTELESMRLQILEFARTRELKGTVLLSGEGINIFVAGDKKSISEFVDFIQGIKGLDNLPVKESMSDHQPFTRMLVRIKKEIISMGVESIRPHQKTSPKLAATQLKEWLDEGRDMTLLDVRNDYEVEIGTFEKAIPIGVETFREFPQAVDQLPDEVKQKPLVMFCTGGIRCEKAGPLMEEKGFQEVYQLDGGILKYFELCGGEHYDGECFVFDKRVALNPELEETGTQQCYTCQSVVTVAEQNSEKYVPGESCPRCYRTPDEKMKMQIARREADFRKIVDPLPGSLPYDNVRPLNVPLRFDRETAFGFVSKLHGHAVEGYWQQEFALGRIVYKGEPLAADAEVRSGWRIEHLLPGTTEPDVNVDIKLLYEDDGLIAINKPAPLPMHPCGRFNRNTLLYLLNQVYPGQRLRMIHRLDANTSGIVLVCRKRVVADWFRTQFEKQQIEKTYLARIQGHPELDRFDCQAPISDGPRKFGQRTVETGGLTALTEFQTLKRLDDGTAIVECRPRTGRTNQIRIHLWHLGHPICGDPAYLREGSLSQSQTKSIGEPPMCLHAWKLKFRRYEGKELELESNRPEWFEARLARYGKGSLR